MITKNNKRNVIASSVIVMARKSCGSGQCKAAEEEAIRLLEDVKKKLSRKYSQRTKKSKSEFVIIVMVVIIGIVFCCASFLWITKQ